jgi:hypothetical protein
MLDKVDGTCGQEMQGKALHNEEILEMIPLHTGLKRKGVI